MLVLVFKVKSLHFVKVMVYKTNQIIYAIFHVLKYVRNSLTLSRKGISDNSNVCYLNLTVCKTSTINCK